MFSLHVRAMYACIVRCEKETETYRGESIHLESLHQADGGEAVFRSYDEARLRLRFTSVSVCVPASSETFTIARLKQTGTVNPVFLPSCQRFSLSVFGRT